MSEPLRAPPKIRRDGLVIVVFLVITMVLDVCLSIGVIILAFRNADISNAEHTNQITACQQANTSRQQDQAVWNVVLKTPKDASAFTRAELSHLRVLIAEKDTLRNCVAAYDTNK